MARKPCIDSPIFRTRFNNRNNRVQKLHLSTIFHIPYSIDLQTFLPAQSTRLYRFARQLSSHEIKRIEVNPDWPGWPCILPRRGLVSSRPRNCGKICEPPRQNLSAARKLNLLRAREVKFTREASKDLRGTE